MKLEQLAARLQMEANVEEEKQYQLQSQRIVERQTRKPDTVTQACRKQVNNLRSQTEGIYEELYQRKLLQLAQQDHVKAKRALMEASLTPSQKAARNEEAREFQVRYSRLVPEAHPDWRTQENPFAEHYRQQSTPSRKSKS